MKGENGNRQNMNTSVIDIDNQTNSSGKLCSRRDESNTEHAPFLPQGNGCATETEPEKVYTPTQCVCKGYVCGECESRFSSKNSIDTNEEHQKKTRGSVCGCRCLIGLLCGIVLTTALFLLVLFIVPRICRLNEGKPEEVEPFVQSPSLGRLYENTSPATAETSASAAHLFLNTYNLKKDSRMVWGQTNQDDEYISSDLSTGNYSGSDKFTCLVISQPGLYNIYSKLTFHFNNRDKKSTAINHTVIRDRNGSRKMILKNRVAISNPEQNSYWPSDLHRVIFLKKNDQLCVAVSDLDLVYESMADNYVGINKIR